MAINIKNPEAEKLAREVSSITGESLTNAIINALKDRLERLKGQSTTKNLSEEIMEISRRCAALPNYDTRTADEILGYNEFGELD